MRPPKHSHARRARSASRREPSARAWVMSSFSSPAEALSACTVNAAHVLDRANRKGRIAPGCDADLVLLDAPDWRYLAYHLGGDLTSRLVVRTPILGRTQAKNQECSTAVGNLGCRSRQD